MMRNIITFLLLGVATVSGLPEAEGQNSVEERGNYGGNYGRTIYVRAGGSIQTALKHAPPGSRIIVEGGTYEEQITIKKDGITLISKGATIRAPDKLIDNECTGFAGPGTQAGICIVGKDIKTSDPPVVEHKKVFSVHKPVRDVTVSGFKVQKFTGFNILVLGAENAVVHDNTLTDGGVYGFLTAGSINTRVFGNIIKSTKTGFIGLCMDNLSDVHVFKNKIGNYYIGLCIQTNGARVEDNEVYNTCGGAFIDPGVKDVLVRGNKISRSLKECGPLGAGGIALDGSINARIENNIVTGQKASAPSAGIAIVDDPCNSPTPSLSCLLRGNKPAIASGNVVKGNILEDNGVDIFVMTKGKGNVIRKNDCTTSSPDGYCRSHY